MKAGFRTSISLIVTISLFSATFKLSGAIAQSLTSTLHGGQLACNGSVVTFTCETRGSDAIAWISDTYIGPGQLAFVAAINNPGDTRPSVSNANTLATLTGEYDDQGVMVLVSTLNITTLPDPQNASVTCIHAVSGDTRTIDFQVIGEPTEAKDIVAVQIQHTQGNCVVHTLWRSQNNDDTQYEVWANEMLMSNDSVVVDTINGTRISALFSIRCAAYEISVSTSNVCGRTPATANYSVTQIPSHSLPELGVVFYPTNPTDGLIVTTDDNTVKGMTTNCGLLQGVVIGVCVVLIAIIIILVGALAVAMIYYKKKMNKGDKPKEETLEIPQPKVIEAKL